MAKTKEKTVQSIEQQIWAAADELRGSMDASEYKHVVLGLIFLKYISDSFEDKYQELLQADDPSWAEDLDSYTEDNIFFVPQEARWSVISEWAHKTGSITNEKGKEETFDIGGIIDRAMRLIEKENDRLKGVLPKNFSRPELDKRKLGSVVDLFSNIQLTDHGKSKDILGRAYQYCLAKFAENEGKRAGEFYTPSSVVRALVEILQPYKGRVYDPCCGSGGMFVQSSDFIKEHQGSLNDISVYGQEFNPTTRKMALMNLAIRGIEANIGERNADTLAEDLHPDLKADFIMANPPFNMSNWNNGSLNEDVRWRFGLPPTGNANMAWIQHMIHHLAPEGKAGIVLANGSLSSNTGGESAIRKGIVDADLLEGIVAMPSQLFHNTQIPVCLWVISRNKKQKGKTLFVDARNLGTMLDRKTRDLTPPDVEVLAKSFRDFDAGELLNKSGFCAVVETSQIAANDYILTPGRYVGQPEEEQDAEPFDDKMKRLTGGLGVMFEESARLEAEIKKQLGAIGYEL